MGGLTIDKLLIILVIALVVLGPERLPYYAQKLGELVKGLKKMADGAKDRVKEEMGDEYDEVDWKQLDPRQYDPRKIIRDALLEEETSPETMQAKAIAASKARRERLKENSKLREMNRAAKATAEYAGLVPFDEEAT